MIFLNLFGLLFLMYSLGLITTLYYWKRLWNDSNKRVNNYRTSFSIIIPFRNEDNNLHSILESVNTINYDANYFEIIFVNDHSIDDSNEVVLEFLKTRHMPNCYLIQLPPNSTGKKQAITAGIESSKNDYILTIDADCKVPSEILIAYNNHIGAHQDALIAGPVVYTSSGNFVNNYQLIENAGLIAFGALGFELHHPFMANGANLCYKKSAFMEVDGFKGNSHIASGDDEFLLEKIHTRFPNNTSFLADKRAIVQTLPQQNWGDLISQRIRWASKGKWRKDKFSFNLQASVFLFLLGFIAMFIAVVFQHPILPFAISATFLKLAIDIIFARVILKSLGTRSTALSIALASLFQIIFIPFIAAYSLRGKYKWKERMHQN